MIERKLSSCKIWANLVKFCTREIFTAEFLGKDIFPEDFVFVGMATSVWQLLAVYIYARAKSADCNIGGR